MALPNKVLPGFSAALYAQSGASPTALTLAQLSTLANVAAIAVSGNLVPVEAVPAFGQDDGLLTLALLDRVNPTRFLLSLHLLL